MRNGSRVEPQPPSNVITRAKALADAGDAGAALLLLRERRGNWGRVPPAYDAMLGRLALLTDDPKAAVEYLTRARDSYRDKMPVEQRRDLGKALFQVGRIWAAGRELDIVAQTGANIGRPRYRAAIEAFANSTGAEPDSGRPTPFCVLAQAQALREEKGVDAAHALLVQRRGAWESVPAAYDAMLGRLSLRSGNWEAAVRFLTLARDNCQGDVPVHIRQQLGVALFALGYFAEAGCELDLAYAAGANVNRAELRIAINAWRRDNRDSAAPIDTTFAGDLTFVDPDKRLIYVSIPKNACTLLKSLYLLNGPHRMAYLSSRKTVHKFCNTIRPTLPDADSKTNGDHFRFVVLRDPLRRLLSAYLDKFVRKRANPDPYDWLQVLRTIRDAQTVLGLRYDPVRSITFEEFVRHVAAAVDVRCDMHWMPQIHMVGNDLGIYDHVGTVERLEDTLDMLSSRFGYSTAESLARTMPSPHNTRYSETAALNAPYGALPAELEEFTNGFPLSELFYTPELRQLVEQRYQADVALHAAALKGR